MCLPSHRKHTQRAAPDSVVGFGTRQHHNVIKKLGGRRHALGGIALVSRRRPASYGAESRGKRHRRTRTFFSPAFNVIRVPWEATAA